jgi:hypothetical protein
VSGNDIEFTPEPWLYVEARSTEAARKFFGAPAGWPVEYDRPTTDGIGSIWRVKADGLILGGKK